MNNINLGKEADGMYYVKAPAKINLTLDVLHKRSDGYHEVEMIMTTVDLADRIGLEIREDGENSNYFCRSLCSK